MNGYNLIIDNKMIKCPTKTHLEYLQYIVSFCKEYKINLLLKGSLSIGQASAFSDVDIVIIEDRIDVIEKLVSGYKNIVMSNVTERPVGILIIVYEDGLCVDLDVRKKITLEEKVSSVVLNYEDLSNYIANEMVRNKDIEIPSIPKRTEWYKVLRLFHRSLIKKGCLKEREAEELLQEIRIILEKENPVLWSNSYVEDIQYALELIEERYTVPVELKKLIKHLIKEVG